VWLVLGSSHQCLQTWVSSGVMTESTAACGNGDAASAIGRPPSGPSSHLGPAAAPGPCTLLPPSRRPGRPWSAGGSCPRPRPSTARDSRDGQSAFFGCFRGSRSPHACLRVQSAVPLETRPIFPLTGCLVPKIARLLVLFSMAAVKLAAIGILACGRYGLGASVRLDVRPKERERERKPRGSKQALACPGHATSRFSPQFRF
jgi:hypothetical protein